MLEQNVLFHSRREVGRVKHVLRGALALSSKFHDINVRRVWCFAVNRINKSVSSPIIITVAIFSAISTAVLTMRVSASSRACLTLNPCCTNFSCSKSFFVIVVGEKLFFWHGCSHRFSEHYTFAEVYCLLLRRSRSADLVLFAAASWG